MSDEIYPGELTAQWLRARLPLRVLSLDCFDTLYWRLVAAPQDVFYPVARTAARSGARWSAVDRARAEAQARKKKLLLDGTSEVSIEDIYARLLGASQPEAIAPAVRREMAEEMVHGVIFRPIARLMCAAKDLGLKVIVVSDIYYASAQLRELLAAADPDLPPLIDEVFCSSEHGVSKGNGLWPVVIKRLGVAPGDILHIGDNYHADRVAPHALGIRSIHLTRFSPGLDAMLSDRDAVALQLFPALRSEKPLTSLFHPRLAAAPTRSPEREVGYRSIGPVMQAFAAFILAEKERLEGEGRRLKVGFLMRDGFLPAAACEVLNAGPVGALLNVSRFTAIASSLETEDDVLRVLVDHLNDKTYGMVLRQLLLPEAISQAILQRVEASSTPGAELLRLLRDPGTMQIIIAKARSLRQGLYRHLTARLDLRAGDRLMVVDLGYTGTAQTCLEPLLKRDLDVDLVGRYLISATRAVDDASRKGLIDVAWVDDRTIAALTGDAIASFEMLCAQSGPSTEGYAADGSPIFARNRHSEHQTRVAQEIQAGCLEFITDCREDRYLAGIGHERLGISAAVDLARSIYFPSSGEIDCLRPFSFDFNLGTDLSMALMDETKARDGMRRTGFLYMNAALEDRRANYAHELRALDPALARELFTLKRFGIEARPLGAGARMQSIPGLLVNGSDSVLQDLDATATHEGFFSLVFPTNVVFDLAFLLGRVYEMIEVEAIEALPAFSAVRGRPLVDGVDYILSGCIGRGHLLDVAIDGFMHFPRVAPNLKAEPYRRLCFRPLVRRASIAAARPA